MATQNSLNKTSEGFTSTAGLTSSGAAVSINSSTNAFGLSTDASATTVNLSTGSAAKINTLGSTNTSSSLVLKFGTADFSMASATGTVMSALDTGEITYPITPAFYAYLSTTANNVTGDGTLVSPVPFGSERFDQGSDFSTDTFTAPVTGRYELIGQVRSGVGATMTTLLVHIVTSNRSILIEATTGAMREVGGSVACLGNGAVLVDMDASDTAILTYVASGSTKTANIIGGVAGTQTFFQGKLIC